MQSFEHEGRIQLCYDGDAQRRVLALPANAIQKALAALALTQHECVSPKLTRSNVLPSTTGAVKCWRARRYGQAAGSAEESPEPAQGRRLGQPRLSTAPAAPRDGPGGGARRRSVRSTPWR